MIVDGLVWARRRMFRKWSAWCLQPTVDNGQCYFEIPMNTYCGIQLKLLSSLAFKLHNLKLTRISDIEQCRSEGRGHCLLLKPERISLPAGQGNGTFQGMVTDPGMLLNFLVIPTFPVLLVGCCLRVRIREIKKYYFKSCSVHLRVCNQMFLIFGDQERMTFMHFLSPLANGSDKPLRKPIHS